MDSGKAPGSQFPTKEDLNMTRFFKIATMALMILAAAASLFAESRPKAAWPAYVLSIFPGLGLGHCYCGENGTTFLVGELAGLATLGVGIHLTVQETVQELASGRRSAGPYLAAVGFGVLAAFRIGELIDIFGAVGRARKAGRISEVVPMVDADIKRASFELGVLVKY
jgi:hypothetical protein